MKELLAVIDMQNDFVFGALGSSDAQAILPAVEERISAARQAGKTVVFTRDTHGEDYLSTQEGKRRGTRYSINLCSQAWNLRSISAARTLKEWNLSAYARISASFPTCF